MPCYAIICLEKMNVHRYVKSENVLGRDESRPKPDPQGILLLMQRWGAAEADTVMVSIVCIHAGEQEREWGRQPHSTLWHQLNFNVLFLLLLLPHLLLPSPLSVTSLQIGNYRYDLGAGKAAGIATVHVDVGHGEWPELTDLKIFKLDELVRALESFGE